MAYANAIKMGLGTDIGSGVRWRCHILCWAAKIGEKLGGAFVECGVNRGFTSRVVCDYIDNLPNFYLLDTYKGFDSKTLSRKQADYIKNWYYAQGKTGDWQQGMYEECYEDAVRTFADKPTVKIVRGTVPDTLPQVKDDRISFLTIDMNCAMPEIAAAEYFWPKMIPGSVIVLDDYGWFGHDEQRTEWTAWSIRNKAPIVSIPTGQGLIVKT